MSRPSYHTFHRSRGMDGCIGNTEVEDIFDGVVPVVITPPPLCCAVILIVSCFRAGNDTVFNIEGG